MKFELINPPGVLIDLPTGFTLPCKSPVRNRLIIKNIIPTKYGGNPMIKLLDLDFQFAKAITFDSHSKRRVYIKFMIIYI